MKIAHLADLHLGYRAYHKTVGSGVNLREADVARAFKEAIQVVIDAKPDLTVVAGDIFHTVRPPNATVTYAFRMFKRLHEETKAPIIMVAGNHESPRSKDTGNILELFNQIDGGASVKVAYNEPRSIHGDDWHVLAVSHNAVLMRPELKPDKSAKYNILLIHAASTQYKPQVRHGAQTIRAEEIDPSDWDYVALGDYHTYTSLKPHVVYPGAIERTSSNIWAEAKEDKGLVVFDTQYPDTHHFVALQSPRPVYDLGPVDCVGLTVSEIDEIIADSLSGKQVQSIARLVLLNVPKQVRRELDQKRIAHYRKQFVHLHLDMRQPQYTTKGSSGGSLPRQGLGEILNDFILQGFRPEDKQLDREALARLGQRYLNEAKTDEDDGGEGT